MKFIKSMAVVCAILAASAAQAELVSAELVPGTYDGLLTRDTSTGYEWLDMTETLGTDYATIQQWTSPGGRYADFKLATAEQVSHMFIQGGWDGSGYIGETGEPVSTDFGDAGFVFSLIGGYFSHCYCGHDSFTAYIQGRVSDVKNPGTHSVFSGDFGVNWIYPFVSSAAVIGQISDSMTDERTGAFLYRDSSISPVPEPATYGLLCAGLAIVGMRLRRKRTS